MLDIRHAAGTAHLKFVRHGPDTVLARSFATSPVKVFATKAGRTACWAYTATLGGGLVGGDEIRMTAEVEADARALLTTQASTKIYRSTRGATQSLFAMVRARGLLAVLPDPIVCFSSAAFTQTQTYELSADASLVVVDWMTSGRHASGERWAFSRYESRIAIERDGRPVFYDAVLLESDLDSVGDRMGRFDVFLTAVLSGPLVAQGAEEIVQSIARTPVRGQADMIQAASKTSDGGILLRIAGTSVEEVGRTVRDSFAFLSSLLGDDPWSRKW